MKGIKVAMMLAVGAAAMAAVCLATNNLGASRADDAAAGDVAVKGVVAQQPTRVACVNIVTVFQQYEKSKQYKDEMEKLLEPIKARGEKLRKKITNLRAQLEEKPDESAIKAAITKTTRDLEDLGKEAEERILKKNEQQVSQLYREVTQAVEDYAKKKQIDLVLAFGENNKSDPFTFANVSRKVQGMEQGGAVTPMYMAGGVDISAPVADMLNRAYKVGRKVSTSRE